MLARDHKEFQQSQHPEIYLLTLKKQDQNGIAPHYGKYIDLQLPDYIGLSNLQPSQGKRLQSKCH